MVLIRKTESVIRTVFLAVLLLPLHSVWGEGFEIDILRDTFFYNENTPASVPLEELLQSCNNRDCDGSIDSPKFVSQEEISGNMNGHEELLLIELNGEKRAYAIKQLTHYKAINDVIGDTPVAITYCPFCATGVVFERSIEGEAVELGASGLLHNSHMVYYDRKTETLYDQISGTGILGKRTGATFNKIPSRIMSWTELKEHHPKAVVSSFTAIDSWDMFSSTKYYEMYADDPKLWFPVKNQSQLLPLKDIVWGVAMKGDAFAISDKYIQKEKSASIPYGNETIEVKHNVDGSVTAHLSTSGKALPIIRSYWFAWYSSNTNTELIN